MAEHDDAGDLSDDHSASPLTSEASVGEESLASCTDSTPGATDVEDYDTAVQASADEVAAAQAKAPRRQARLAVTVASLIVVAAAGLVGWLSFRAYESYQANQQSKLFLQAGRQAAENLTTIDWQQAEADMQRIKDSAVGDFYEDFDERSQIFVQAVKEAEAKSVGTIAEAGIESVSDGEAQVLVAVSVKTSYVGTAEEEDPRFWRMRITVKDTDDGVKMSNVAFVP